MRRLMPPFVFRRSASFARTMVWQPPTFEEDEWPRRRAERKRVWWRVHFDWMMKQPRMARPVIVVAWLTIAYLAFVLGFVVGGALWPMIR
jgi:hypothetical protein